MKELFALYLLLVKHGLFYLDSKTNPNSVVPKIGKELGVPIIENQLFLMMCIQQDIFQNKPNYSSKIQEKPIMVAIGHVGPPGEITSRVIETSIPKIREHADFIFLSDLALSRLLFQNKVHYSHIISLTNWAFMGNPSPLNFFTCAEF